MKRLAFTSKTTSYKHAYVLGIPSPKQYLDGSQFRSGYYEDGDIERIRKYCVLDVLATAQVFLRLLNGELFTDDKMVYVSNITAFAAVVFSIKL